jgi:hypothetical protein
MREAPMAEQRIHTSLSASTGLHVCPACGSDLVQPVSWAPAALESWQVDLRCPNCEWTGRAIAPQDEVDDYDVILDEGAHLLNRALLTATSPAIDAELERLLTKLPSQRR